MNSIEPKTHCPPFADRKKDDFVAKKPKPPMIPGVGQYKESDRKHVNAKDVRSPNFSFGRTKRPSIIQEVAKSRQGNPGVGKYLKVAEQFDKSYRHPSITKSRL